MTNDIVEWMPHKVAELLCVKCLHRGIHVYPAYLKLKDLECGDCMETGFLINTGESME